MLEFVTLENAGELDEFVTRHPGCHYMQTSYWGRVKNDWGWQGIISWGEDGKIRGTAAVLLRKVRGINRYLLYAPRGPIWNPGDEGAFAEILEGIRHLARQSHRGYLFRMDPQLLSGDEEACAMVERYGFSISPINDFSAFQARLVYQINLKGRSLEEIMASFPQKTRYNIRLAGRKGVRVAARGPEALPDFCAMTDATARRDGFTPKGIDYFENFLRAFGPYARLYMAYVGDTAVSGAIAIQMGGKTWYAYGCSGENHRNYMGCYLLQREMISWAVESGCSLYDFRGVEGYPAEGNPGEGLHRFKQGFGSHLVEFMGQMDLPLGWDWRLIQGVRALYGCIRR